MGLLSSWLGTAIGSGAVAGSSEAAAESREDIGGLSQVLAEILASLQNTFAGTSLDVEISYEGLSEVSPPPYPSPNVPSCSRWRHNVAPTCQGAKEVLAAGALWDVGALNRAQLCCRGKTQRLTLRSTLSWCLFWSLSFWTRNCRPLARSGPGESPHAPLSRGPDS